MALASFELLRTEKNHNMLHSGGYLYWKNQAKGDRTYWMCIYRNKNAPSIDSKCPGYAVTAGDTIRVTTPHNHAPDPTVVERKRQSRSNLQAALWSFSRHSTPSERAITMERDDHLAMDGEDSKVEVRDELVFENNEAGDIQHQWIDVTPSTSQSPAEVQCNGDAFQQSDGDAFQPSNGDAFQSSDGEAAMSSSGAVQQQTNIRQNYSADVEVAVNKQISIEMYTSNVYLSMCFYFDHNDVALANIAKWFQQRSDERRNYAIRLMRQQNARGGRVALQNVRKPERDEWGSPLDAFESALVLEKFSNASFLELHKLAASSNDAQMCHFLEDTFFREQVESIAKIGKIITNLKRVGKGLGEFVFDKQFVNS